MPPLAPSSIHRILSRFVPVDRQELRALLWSFLCFFTLLASYYVLRPVRDEMGVQTGAQNLPWLFSAVFVSMLVLVPLFGWIAGRLPVRRLIPTIYLFFLEQSAPFFPRPDHRCPSHDGGSGVLCVGERLQPVRGLGVLERHGGSVFHRVCATAIRIHCGRWEQRGYCRPTVYRADGAVPRLAPLLLVSIGLLLTAMTCFFAVLRTHPRHDREGACATILKPQVDERAPPSLWVGLTKILQSRYFLGICLYLACYSVLSTMLYSQQMVLVPQVVGSAEERTQLFAWVDFAVNGLTVLTQVLLTGRLLAGLGVTVMLVLVPAFNVVGFSVFSLAPDFSRAGCLRRFCVEPGNLRLPSRLGRPYSRSCRRKKNIRRRT